MPQGIIRINYLPTMWGFDVQKLQDDSLLRLLLILR